MAWKLLLITILPPVLLSCTLVNIFSFSSERSSASRYEVVPIDGGDGPESFEFDSLGEGPYTGISDGRIIKWHAKMKRWTDFAATSPNRDSCGGPHDHHRMEPICGRPLGLCFNKMDGHLYIADAYMGLLKVGPDGGLATNLVTHAQGIPLRFTNSLDIDQSNEAVYFTDSSSQYQRRNYLSVVLSGDKSGRLMRYDPGNQQVEVLVDKLAFPNGVALNNDGSFVLLAETSSCRVLRYWIKTSRAGSLEVFAQLPGFPDNIKRSPRGGYWVAMSYKRDRLSDWLFSQPWIGSALLKLIPLDITRLQSALAKFKGRGFAVRLGDDGDVLETFEGKVYGSKLISASISEVMEKDGKLWIGSIDLPFAVRFEI